jgi:hypothetical protein
MFISFRILTCVLSWLETVKIQESKMAAKNRVQYHPPPLSLFLWRPKNTSKIKRCHHPNRRVASLYSILFAPTQVHEAPSWSSQPFASGTLHGEIYNRVLALLQVMLVGGEPGETRLSYVLSYTIQSEPVTDMGQDIHLHLPWCIQSVFALIFICTYMY